MKPDMNFGRVLMAITGQFVVITVVTAGMAGCSAKHDEAQATSAVGAAGTVETGKKDVQSPQKMPISLNLYGQKVGDTVVLDLVVDVAKKLPIAPEINFKLPEGTEVRSTTPITAIKMSPLAGQSMRRYQFANVRGPIVVTADVTSPSFGYHAEAQWPPKEQQIIVPPKEIDIPAVTIHGIPVDRAIQLDPGQREDRGGKAAGR